MANSETHIDMMEEKANRLDAIYHFQMYEAEKQRKQRAWTLTSITLGVVSSLIAALSFANLIGSSIYSNKGTSNSITERISDLEQRIENTDLNLISTIDSQTEALKNYELQAFGPEGTVAIKEIGLDLKSLEVKITDLQEVINTNPEKVIKNALLQDRISDVEVKIKSFEEAQNERFSLVYKIIGASMGGLFIALLIQLLGQIFNSRPQIKKIEE